MWIMTQNRQRIINSDQIVNIFVDKTGLKVMASTRNKDVFVIGYYSDRDASLKALDGLSSVIGLDMPIATMPLSGAVDAWVEDTAKVAVDYIHKDFGWIWEKGKNG